MLIDFRRPRNESNSEELVYFAVTNVECRSQLNGHANGFSELSVGYGSGELGCWVDTAETRMVQTGVEHARAPDATAYMGAHDVVVRLASLTHKGRTTSSEE